MRGNMLGSGGGSVDTDALTAIASKVLEGLIFIGSGSEDEQIGTMPDVSAVDTAQAVEYANGLFKVGMTLGAHLTASGIGFPEVDVPQETITSLIGLVASAIAYGTTIAGVAGTYGSDGNLTAESLVAGKIGYGANGRVEGQADNFGSVYKSLAAGQSYDIAKGFYGDGRITAKDLASQTAATAAAAQILSGYAAWVNGSKINGNMPNRGAVTKELSAGGSYTIPIGYHDGAGVVSAKDLASQTAANATAAQILSGKTAWVNGVKVTGTIGSKAAATYTPTTTDQEITAAQYLAGKQTIKGDAKLLAANIAKGVSIFGVTGTWYGNKKCLSAFAVYGFGADSSDYETSDEASFTMPAAGRVYYGGISAFRGATGNGTCEIYKNGELIDSRNGADNRYWRNTMVDKNFMAVSGDVVKVKCTATSGTATLCFMQAVIVY